MEHSHQDTSTELSHISPSVQPDINSPNHTTETPTLEETLSISAPSTIDPTAIATQTQPAPSSEHPSSQSRNHESASYPSFPPDISTIVAHLGLSRIATHSFGVWRFSNTHVKALAKAVAEIAESMPVELVQQPGLLRPNIDTLLGEFGTRIWGRDQNRASLDESDGVLGSEKGLMYEDDQDREIIKSGLRAWVVARVMGSFRYQKFKTQEMARQDQESVLQRPPAITSGRDFVVAPVGMMRLDDEAVEATTDDNGNAVQETVEAFELASDNLGLAQSDERENPSEIFGLAKNDAKDMNEVGNDTHLHAALPDVEQAPPDESRLPIREQQPVLSRPCALPSIAGIANTSSSTSDLTVATTLVAPVETTDQSDVCATEPALLNDKTSELNDDTKLKSTATENTFDNVGHTFTLPVGRTKPTNDTKLRRPMAKRQIDRNLSDSTIVRSKGEDQAPSAHARPVGPELPIEHASQHSDVPTNVARPEQTTTFQEYIVPQNIVPRRNKTLPLNEYWTHMDWQGFVLRTSISIKVLVSSMGFLTKRSLSGMVVNHPKGFKLSEEVNSLATKLYARLSVAELVNAAADSSHLNDEIDLLLDEYAPDIWGMDADRSLLLVAGSDVAYPKDLVYEDDDDRKMLWMHMHQWIFKRAFDELKKFGNSDDARKKALNTLAPATVDGAVQTAIHGSAAPTQELKSKAPGSKRKMSAKRKSVTPAQDHRPLRILGGTNTILLSKRKTPPSPKGDGIAKHSSKRPRPSPPLCIPSAPLINAFLTYLNRPIARPRNELAYLAIISQSLSILIPALPTLFSTTPALAFFFPEVLNVWLTYRHIVHDVALRLSKSADEQLNPIQRKMLHSRLLTRLRMARNEYLRADEGEEAGCEDVICLGFARLQGQQEGGEVWIEVRAGLKKLEKGVFELADELMVGGAKWVQMAG
ncbi:hypothetical protein FB567DRAFT_579092 [Paraphoma chrysanthemicola]|uniref:Uncharacterized protein n=1 Tax=Paraphoma chrysanthemicola TaxID=798071 RepID=A0A8K0R6P1_9PLEO|nr:hypothetical protein FB567DRAFT_579092 [Paraphoma chrysanthemicola]